MSNYQQATIHPETGELQVADWLDDYFGRHCYGVRFPDGKVFPASEIETIEPASVKADSLSKQDVQTCRCSRISDSVTLAPPASEAISTGGDRGKDGDVEQWKTQS